MTSAHPVEIVALLVSPVHAYEGRPRNGPRPDAGGGARDHIDIRAGLGIVGDRYHAQAAHRHAAVTVFAAESLDAVTPVAGSPPPDPLLTRRNVVLRGFPVDELASARDHDGAEFSLDSGGGPIRFRAHRPARPCGWLDVVLAPGAQRALRGRGGVRCEPLDDGRLDLGPAVLRVLRAPAVAVAAVGGSPRTGDLGR
ncbi:MAG: molybdenum cofactor biosysynthesis protein [Pseudonocardia sp.]|nr:molybdenum cofactor biosysynthesis protein [Pseudonocardia sp.]